MPAPVTTTYYCSTASYTSSLGQPIRFGALTPVAPPTPSVTAWGWNNGALNPPRFCEMNWKVEVLRTSTQWTVTPTASLPNNNAGGSGTGNSFIMGPFHGEFLPGNWVVTMSVRPISDPQAHSGQFIWKIWKGSDISGSNAERITGSFLSSSVVAMNGTTATFFTSGSYFLPRINLRDEYIFIHTYWSIIASSGNNNNDTDLLLGTGSNWTPPPFVPDKSSFFRWIGNSND